MKRPVIVVLNLILIIAGFLVIYSDPLSAFAITLGMLLISISIISFAILVYFPPPQPKYVRLKVIEEATKTAPKIHQRSKMKRKPKKKAKRSRKR